MARPANSIPIRMATIVDNGAALTMASITNRIGALTAIAQCITRPMRLIRLGADAVYRGHSKLRSVFSIRREIYHTGGSLASQ